MFDFIEALDDYQKSLASYVQDGNTEILRAVDEHLDRAAAGL